MENRRGWGVFGDFVSWFSPSVRGCLWLFVDPGISPCTTFFFQGFQIRIRDSKARGERDESTFCYNFKLLFKNSNQSFTI